MAKSWLVIGGSSAFVLTTLLRWWQLLHEDVKVIAGSGVRLKKALTTALIALQALRVLKTSLPGYTGDQTSSIAEAFRLLAWIAVLWLSWLEHQFAVRPSTLLTLFLFVELAQDALNVLYSAPTTLLGSSDGLLVVLHAVLLAVLFFAECRTKQRILKARYANLPPDVLAGLFDRLLFWWVNIIIYEGRSKPMSALPNLDETFSSRSLRWRILNAWRFRADGKRMLPTALLRCLMRPFMAVIPVRICLIAFKYAQPILMSRTIDFVTSSAQSDPLYPSACSIIAAAVVVYFGLAVCNTAYLHRLDRLKTMIRGCLVTLIHDKVLCMDSSISSPEDGKAITLMSTDVESLLGTAEMFHETWAQAAEVIIGMVLLTRKVGWISPILLISIFGCSRVSRYVAQHLKPKQRAWNEATQKRLAVTSSLLNAMKSVRMTGAAHAMQRKLLQLRREEIEASRQQRWIMVAANASANALGLFSPAIVLAVFALVDYYWNDKGLTAGTAFTTVAILTMVTHPANMIMTIVPRAIASLAGFERVEAYLLEPAQRQYRVIVRGAENAKHAPAILLTAVNIGFSSKQCAILENINLAIPQGSFVACLGAVGSGKTSLARAIAGDLQPSDGSIVVTSDKISLCTQHPWLPAGTLQEVVCGLDSSYQTEWYDTVISACCLDSDISALPEKHQTQVGSRGGNLSGGQRQRVALARAVYSRNPLLILDDPFSALDGATEARIIHNLFGDTGLCRRLKTTVFLTTNSTVVCSSMDHVVVIANRTVQAQGSWHAVSSDPALVRCIGLDTSDHVIDTLSSMLEDDRGKLPDVVLHDSAANLARTANDSGIHGYYLRAAGVRNLLTLAACTASFAIFVTLPQYWLKWWTEAGDQKTLYFAVGYLLLAFAAWISTNGTMWTAHIRVALESGQNIHASLLSIITRARLSYFFSTEIGTTLNRFGQDIQVVDRELPTGLAALSNQVFKLCMQSTALIYVNPLLVATLSLCVLVVYFVQRWYLRISRQLRFLDLHSRARVFTSFIETAEGLATIRAFAWQGACADQNSLSLDASQRPYFYSLCLQRWLNIVLDLVVAGIAVLTIVLTMVLRNDTTGAKMGMSLNVVLVANTTLLRLVESWTTLEISAGTIARLKELESVVPCEDNAPVLQDPDGSWPHAGRLVLQNVQVSYNHRAIALRGINIVIEPGQKILVCGRTGSGKSTLILALLRLLDAEQGKIFVDNVNLAHIPLARVREQCFITIPQDPFTVIEASLRFNIDVSESYSDEQIIFAMKAAHLWPLFEKAGQERRHLSVSDGTSNNVLDLPLACFPPLTPGQLQLLSVARAIVRIQQPPRSGTETGMPMPILLLDEATSSLDSTMEKLVRDLVQTHFAQHTVIMVAHRLGTTPEICERHKFDQTIWLEEGRVVSRAATSGVLPDS